MIHILYTKSYDRTLKKLNKYQKEKQILMNILDFIRNSGNIQSIKISGLSLMYGFEQLKHNLNRYHSFNLSKNGGVIRLIVYLDITRECVELLYISYDHYEDFDESKVIYYDE